MIRTNVGILLMIFTLGMVSTWQALSIATLILDLYLKHSHFQGQIQIAFRSNIGKLVKILNTFTLHTYEGWNNFIKVTCHSKTKFVTVKWYNLWLHITQSQMCSPQIQRQNILSANFYLNGKGRKLPRCWAGWGKVQNELIPCSS